MGSACARGRRPAARKVLRLVFAFALLGAFLPASRTMAQTVIDVSSAADLVSALTTVDNNPGTSYRLNITADITLVASDTLPAINSASSVAIDGNGHTLDGGNVQRGIFAYAGTVSISDMDDPARNRCGRYRR